MRQCGCWLACILAAVLATGCEEQTQYEAAEALEIQADAVPEGAVAADRAAVREDAMRPAGRLEGPTLLLSQAQFFRNENAEPGKPRVRPGPARLVILRPSGDGKWSKEVIEDRESNVFHKAIIWTDPLHPELGHGILTIAAQRAAIKFWRPTPDGWQSRTLWQGEFGGKWNRLRDVEIGDVTGDGKDDIVIVTHDQGVVLVLQQHGSTWQADEIDRKKDCIIHEVELADLDGDGRKEIYATPSQPNRFNNQAQPGAIVVYRYVDGGFKKNVVEAFKLRHAKEILACDPDGDGHPVLLASVEGELGSRADAPPEAKRAFVNRYRYVNGEYVGDVVGWLPDSMCRFLVMGDVDGDGKPDLVAATHKKGLWWAKVRPGEWKFDLIEENSGGFEHATTLADLDGNGVMEIYVAADKQQEICRHTWTGSGWKTDVLADIDDDKLTFNIYATEL